MNLMITGVSGHIGQAAVHHLTHQNPFKRVFAMDMIPPAFLGPCHFIQADLRNIELADVLITADIHYVLHLAFNDQNAPCESDAATAKQLLLAASMAGVRRVVIPSRDWIYRRSETPSDESAPLRTLSGVQKRCAAVKSRFAGQMGLAPVEAKLMLEAMIGQYQKRPDAVSVVVPRLCSVLSDQYDQPLEHILQGPMIFGPTAYDPGFQFLHIDDAARLLVSCTTIPGLEGPYNIAGSDVLSLETVAGILEKRLIRLPTWVMGLMVSCLSPMGLLRFEFNDLVRFHLAASTCTQKSDFALGKPVYSSRQALALWRADAPK